MQNNGSQESGQEPPSGGTLEFFVRPTRKLLNLLLHWAPLWTPIVLLLMILLLGLKPALEERSRLEAQRPAVEARHKSSRKAYLQAQREHDAWQDPIFQARKERIWHAQTEARRRELKALTDDQPQADDPQ
ncbi:MAG TPA: hypothetical protein EYQ25_10090 [Planctomycetes bacterium]|nr:hypothetical protein [Planctomycetota bacterium]